MPMKIDPYADAQVVPALQDHVLKRVTTLAQSLVSQERHVTKLELDLKAAKEVARKLREEDVPDAMQEVGLKQFTLTTGEIIKVEGFITCSLGDGVMATAIAWLRQTGHTGLIRREVTVAFGKGKDAMAAALADDLMKRGFAVENIESVNTTSFKALLREVIAEPVPGAPPIPLAELGAYAGRRAVITFPKPPDEGV